MLHQGGTARRGGLKLTRRIGSLRIDLPVAARNAFATAGPIGGTPGSPTPVGGSSEGTMCTSTRGIWSIRSGVYVS